MPRSKQRRIHIELAPPVEVQVGERLVGFVGANLLNRVVMVGYDVDPAISERRPPFGPCLLILEVTDDAEGDVYPTRWEDFPWPQVAPGRMTTHLDRRPPGAATCLRVEVREPVGDGVTARPRPGAPLTEFEIPLPEGHAALRTIRAD